jgi:hypothetical protein
MTYITLTPPTSEAGIDTLSRNDGSVTSLILREMGSHELGDALDCLTNNPRLLDHISEVGLSTCCLTRDSVSSLVKLFPIIGSRLVEFSIDFSDWYVPLNLAHTLSSGLIDRSLLLSLSETDKRVHWELYAAGQELISGLFRFCPRLKRMRIDNSQVDILWRPYLDLNEGLTSFLSLTFACLPESLEELSFESAGFSDAHVADIRPCIGVHAPRCLRKINFANNKLTDLGLIALLTSDVRYEAAHASGSTECRVDLDLTDNQITFKYEILRVRVVSALEKYPFLTINVSENPLEVIIDHPRLIFDKESKKRDAEQMDPTVNFEEDADDDDDDSSFSGSSGDSDWSSDTSSDSDVSLKTESSLEV